jgi:hypothetical protein
MHLIVYDSVHSGRNVAKFRKISLLPSRTSETWKYFLENISFSIFPEVFLNIYNATRCQTPQNHNPFPNCYLKSHSALINYSGALPLEITRPSKEFRITDVLNYVSIL